MTVSEEATWNVFYLGGLLIVIGSLLFGVVFLRNSKAWFGALLLAIGVLGILEVVFLMGPFEATALATVVLPILFGLAWTVLGYALWVYEAELPGDRPIEQDSRTRLDGAAKAAETPVLPARR